MKEIRIGASSASSTKDGAYSALRAALRQLHPGPGRIVFEPGCYDFREEEAEAVWLNASNHDNTRIPVACVLRGFRGLELRGENAEWVLHGRMAALLATDCQGLKISGLRVRSAHPYLVEGRVTGKEDGHVDIRLDEPHTFVVRDGYAVFRDDAFAGLRTYLQLQGFDPETGLLAEGAPNNLGSFFLNRTKAVDASTVRLFVDRDDLQPGQRAVLKTERRWTPALTLDRCVDTRISECVLHDAGGMGLIAQFCTDLRLRRLCVTPPPGSGRLMSVQDDATHFVHCRGALTLEDCAFDGQWDDAVNVQGTYRKLVNRLSARECFAANMHFQQMGLETFHPGDAVCLREAETLRPVFESTVDSVFTINPQITRLALRDAMPERLPDNCVWGNETWHPEVTIRGCRFSESLPRGVLIQTNRPSRIENSLFRNIPEAAVATPAEANFWYEGGGLSQLEIIGNTFECCGYNPSFRGEAGVLDFQPHIKNSAFFYHHTIRVADNRFLGVREPLIRCNSVRRLVNEGNEILSEEHSPVGIAAQS